ncbi:MAG: alpha/beta hydrolase [Cyclobacteriaceae bacterium]
MINFIYKSLGLYLNTLTRISPERGGKAGFNLFCTPQRTKIKRKQLDFLKTASQSDFDFNGRKIRTYQWGNGPVKVLFVHGWQSFTFRWKKYIEALLDKNFTLVGFDAPGHGLSEGKRFTVPQNAYLIQQLVNHYNGFDAVVTHSIGSFSFFYAMAKFQLPSIGKLIAMASPGSASEFISFYTKTLKLKPDTVWNIKNEFQQYVKEEIEKISLVHMVKNLSLPGLIIHDREDPRTNYTNALSLQEHWDNSQLLTTDGLGHNLRSPDVVNAVRDFILAKNI